ncbi:unnamed protein product [Caenorhabditis brenneri]
MTVVVVNGDGDFSRKFAAGNGKAVFIDFTASWCGPCQHIAPVFSDLANQYKGSVFLKVDVDQCSGTAATYGVKAMPTFMAFVNGQQKETLQGANEGGLRSMVSKYGSKSAAWSGAGQRLSDGPSTAPPPRNFAGQSTNPPPRPNGAPATHGSNPLEPLLNIIETVNERGHGLGIPDMNAGGFLIQPFHILLALVLLFLFGPFGALISLAICFFTQPRGAGGPGPRGQPGSGPSNRPPQNQGPRSFGGSGQRLGGN